jgi:hypothetical protein
MSRKSNIPQRREPRSFNRAASLAGHFFQDGAIGVDFWTTIARLFWSSHSPCCLRSSARISRLMFASFAGRYLCRAWRSALRDAGQAHRLKQFDDAPGSPKIRTSWIIITSRPQERCGAQPLKQLRGCTEGRTWILTPPPRPHRRPPELAAPTNPTGAPGQKVLAPTNCSSLSSAGASMPNRDIPVFWRTPPPRLASLPTASTRHLPQTPGNCASWVPISRVH